ncbi:MAG TPA: hypothetical protein VLW50_08835 [Streptosporangiaceae bacterium]|nr:hypothetical protein [Streptosporangiaceae bacterium]
MKLKLADHHRHAAPHPDWEGGALVIRAPVIIAALREYFELLWERETRSPRAGPSQRQAGCHRPSRRFWS